MIIVTIDGAPAVSTVERTGRAVDVVPAMRVERRQLVPPPTSTAIRTGSGRESMARKQSSDGG